MDPAEQDSVRAFCGPSERAHRLGFFAVVLLEQLTKAADMAGVVALDAGATSDLCASVASAIGCPEIQFVRDHLPRLRRAGLVQVRKKTFLLLPLYREEQFANASRELTVRRSLTKKRDLRNAIALGIIDEDEAANAA